jgi:hypothetical protein
MNLREIENQISNLRVRSYKYEKKVRELEDKVQDLETKTASDLSQTVVAESTTSEEQDCLWVARDKDGDLYAHSIKPALQNFCFENEEGYFIIYDKKFPQVTFENSPQKLVLAPVVAESETSEEGYVPTVDDFFYNPEEENSEKPNNQDAFTELRAKLKELENEQFNDSWDDGVRYAVNKIREVIE